MEICAARDGWDVPRDMREKLIENLLEMAFDKTATQELRMRATNALLSVQKQNHLSIRDESIIAAKSREHGELQSSAVPQETRVSKGADKIEVMIKMAEKAQSPEELKLIKQMIARVYGDQDTIDGEVIKEKPEES